MFTVQAIRHEGPYSVHGQEMLLFISILSKKAIFLQVLFMVQHSRNVALCAVTSCNL